MIEFDMLAMPMPAPIFDRTMARAEQSPIIRGPIISLMGIVVISFG